MRVLEQRHFSASPALTHLQLRLEESDPTQGMLLTGFELDEIEGFYADVAQQLTNRMLYGFSAVKVRWSKTPPARVACAPCPSQ